MNHLIFVCTGNTCRSPMAAALCRKLAEERGLAGLAIESMGLAAAPGDPASPAAVTALKERGLDIAAHRARQADPETLLAADHIVCMSRSHRIILEGAGIPAEKITVLGVGIPDPFGGSLADYRACRDAIEAALPGLLDSLYPLDETGEQP